MNVAEAELAISAEWKRWGKTNLAADHKATGKVALIFFGYLQANCPYLLDFRFSGDKWQRVHGWLNRNNCVS